VTWVGLFGPGGRDAAGYGRQDARRYKSQQCQDTQIPDWRMIPLDVESTTTTIAQAK
jgi:hypothetical protein